MKMTYTKSAFEMPDGKYLAKFLGVTLRDDKPGDKPRLGQDGNPLPPAMTWDFEIAEGPEKGKKADKLTGRIPTPKSGCGKMLAAIADTVLKDGIEVDLSNYVGRLYRITIEENRVSDRSPPVYVPATQAPAAGGLGADGMPVQPPTPDMNARWDAKDANGDYLLDKSTAEMMHWFATIGADPAKIMMRPAGAKTVAPKSAAELGFGAPQPAEIPW